MIYKNSKGRVFVRIRGFVAGDFVGGVIVMDYFPYQLNNQSTCAGVDKTILLSETAREH